MMIKKLLIIILLIAITSLLHAETNQDQAKAIPDIEFIRLGNPGTFGLHFFNENGILRSGPLGDNPFRPAKRELKYAMDAVIPSSYHPQGKVTGAFQLDFRWIITGETVRAPQFEGSNSDIQDIKKSYLGGLSIVIAEMEATQDSMRNVWSPKSYNIGVTGEQRFGIPFIRMREGVSLPPVFILGLKHANRPNRNNFRASTELRVDQITLMNQLFLRMEGQVNAEEGYRTGVYGVVGLYYRLIGFDWLSAFLSAIDPIVFIRYSSGNKPPDYINVNVLEAGIGIQTVISTGGE